MSGEESEEEQDSPQSSPFTGSLDTSAVRSSPVEGDNKSDNGSVTSDLFSCLSGKPGSARSAKTKNDPANAKQPGEEKSSRGKGLSASSKSKDEQKPPKEAETIKFKDWPSAVQYRKWRVGLLTTVAASHPTPKKAMNWFRKALIATKMDDLVDDPEIFPTLDIKIAAGLQRIIHGEFGRKVSILEEKY